MSDKPNPKQLVLRRDTATGLTLVGWEEDLPIGRFEHLEVICALAKNILPECDTEDYASYQSALQNARQANGLMLEQQTRQCQAKGWHVVRFELAHNPDAMKADSFGNFTTTTIQLHYQLTKNRKQA
jgi:hypothetical protein